MRAFSMILVAAVALVFVSANTQAAEIHDVSVLLSKPHELIDFDSDARKIPLMIPENGWLLMPADEYAPYGVTFSPQIKWVNDNSAEFEAAQAIGGSPDIAIPGVGVNDFTMSFVHEVSAFGFWVVHNTRAAQRPVFEAYDAGGNLIETATFAGAAVDGMVGLTEYGFFGIESSTPIKSVRITKQAAILDNLMFSPPVPEPSTAALFALAGLAALRRRR